ncbi:hypothetical protein G9A89_003545 [Geosiphon pyriformis]|nr:hypothetical protein G9A89_003545 [Geosiphon pyriformis]
MAPNQNFFANLSQDLTSLLESNVFYDAIITVGEEQNKKTFQAHLAVLVARSPYFAAALKNDWVKRENNLYLYSGNISLEGLDLITVFNILVAADEFFLEEIIDYIQDHLIENYSKSLQQNFIAVHQTAYLFASFTKLQDYCKDLLTGFPTILFKSDDFISFQETSLLEMLKRDDLDVDEVDIWENILRWGIAQNPSIKENVKTWSQKDFSDLQMTLKQLIPLIRFFNMDSDEFYFKVKPYARILPAALYEQLLRHFLVDGNSIRNSVIINRISPSPSFPPSQSIPPSTRNSTQTMPVGRISLLPSLFNSVSTLLKAKHIRRISAWIEGNDKMTPPRATSQYELKLLLRGSRDGFTPADFHRLCDKKGATIIVIKVKGSGNMIGGYNPVSWDPRNPWIKGDESFIFSLGDGRTRNAKISRFQSGDGIAYSSSYGPIFGKGHDLALCSDNFQTTLGCHCKKSNSYEFPVLEEAANGRVNFFVDDYEVFQVVPGSLKSPRLHSNPGD